MALDIRIQYIKQNIPHDIWVKNVEKAHTEKKTIYEYYVNLFKKYTNGDDKEWKQNNKCIKSKFPNNLWIKGKVIAISEGKTFKEWLKNISEVN